MSMSIPCFYFILGNHCVLPGLTQGLLMFLPFVNSYSTLNKGYTQFPITIKIMSKLLTTVFRRFFITSLSYNARYFVPYDSTIMYLATSYVIICLTPSLSSPIPLYLVNHWELSFSCLLWIPKPYQSALPRSPIVPVSPAQYTYIMLPRLITWNYIHIGCQQLQGGNYVFLFTPKPWLNYCLREGENCLRFTFM